MRAQVHQMVVQRLIALEMGSVVQVAMLLPNVATPIVSGMVDHNQVAETMVPAMPHGKMHQAGIVEHERKMQMSTGHLMVQTNLCHCQGHGTKSVTQCHLSQLPISTQGGTPWVAPRTAITVWVEVVVIMAHHQVETEEDTMAILEVMQPQEAMQ
jgi:hypothetical protein